VTAFQAAADSARRTGDFDAKRVAVTFPRLIPEDAQTMAKVLIIEDQPHLLRSLLQAVQEAGLEAVGTDSLSRASELCRSSFDLIVLDLMLPDGNGLDWLQQLRASGQRTLVLVLTARDTVEDRIAGLDNGADDYLVKPFALNELLARIRALLRRDQSSAAVTLTVADVRLDLLNRTVYRGSVRVELPQKQFELLVCLMRQPGQILTRQEIAETVWNNPAATWTNVIEVQINQLRRRLHLEGLPAVLFTVRGKGYQIGGPQ
jgi:DNA-binding response OmpR family regulator